MDCALVGSISRILPRTDWDRSRPFPVKEVGKSLQNHGTQPVSRDKQSLFLVYSLLCTEDVSHERVHLSLNPESQQLYCVSYAIVQISLPEEPPIDFRSVHTLKSPLCPNLTAGRFPLSFRVVTAASCLSFARTIPEQKVVTEKVYQGDRVMLAEWISVHG